ncbi:MULTISPECIES: hypothetical protein [unclassified Rhodococcus (in: high G+C Gram-positive bacteria)]|nr:MULTISPECIES: hypothetical protein [unclassified Rhodococcus (in: high G+C Gram-positive bacteria)]
MTRVIETITVAIRTVLTTIVFTVMIAAIVTGWALSELAAAAVRIVEE